jgi:hypothetical protein
LHERMTTGAGGEGRFESFAKVQGAGRKRS